MWSMITWSTVRAMLAPAELSGGRTPLSHVAGFSVCTEPLLAAFSRFVKELR